MDTKRQELEGNRGPRSELGRIARLASFNRVLVLLVDCVGHL